MTNKKKELTQREIEIETKKLEKLIEADMKVDNMYAKHVSIDLMLVPISYSTLRSSLHCMYITSCSSKILNKISSKLSSVLSSAPQIQALTFTDSWVCNTSALAVSKILQNCPHILSLGFQWCKITRHSLEKIKNTLYENNSIVSLTFFYYKSFREPLYETMLPFIENNRFITMLHTSCFGFHPAQQSIDNILEINRTLVKDLASFLFNKFNYNMQDNSGFKAGIYYFYQRADKELLKEELKKNFQSSGNDESAAVNNTQAILNQTDTYISAHYFKMRGICKNPTFVIYRSGEDGQIDMTNVIPVPGFVFSHILFYIPKSLWAGDPTLRTKNPMNDMNSNAAPSESFPAKQDDCFMQHINFDFLKENTDISEFMGENSFCPDTYNNRSPG